MRMRFATKTLLAVLALLAFAGIGALSAMASTGGVSSPSTTPAKAAPASSTPAQAHKAHKASWFGPGFYGHKTACGQTLTPVIVGVANRTLPCGTLVSFTYQGHQLTVPVLDRGPYAKGVDWDLTAAAAQALGVLETVPVASKVVGQTSNTPLLGVPAGTPAFEAVGGTAAS